MRLWKTAKFRKNPFRTGFSAPFRTLQNGKPLPKPTEIKGKPVGFLPTSPLLRHGMSQLARITVSRSPHRKTFPTEPVENRILGIPPKSFPRFPRSFPQPREFRFSTRFRRTFRLFRAVSTSFLHFSRPFPTPFPHPVESLWKTHRICWKIPRCRWKTPQIQIGQFQANERDSRTFYRHAPPA